VRYFLLNIGCQMNLSDAERIRAVVESIGYTPTENEDEADLLGVVSCSVRQRAIDKVYARIARWNRIKAHRAVLTFVSGCVLPADRDRFLELFDILFSIEQLAELPDMIRQYGIVTPAAARAAELPGAGAPADAAPIEGFWRIAPQYSSTFEAYVPIQNGCDKFCTFCAVPYTRGREISRPSADILAEIESLVAQGYRSITLLGQNVNSYGLDRRGAEVGFAGLLRSIGEMGRKSGREFWVYFTSPHPHDMTDEVLETIAACPHLGKQIHLPLQSGDDKVLIRMNRTYRLEGYRAVVESIRRILPTATLFTDIIVGFCGETEAQFQATRAAMREFRYNMAYIAAYSPRPGAASSRWGDDVPHEEKKRRLHELSEELKLTSGAANKAMVGSTVRVLVTEPDRRPGFVSGRTEGRIPVRLPALRGHVPGRLLDMRVTSASALSIEGEAAAPLAREAALAVRP
jgi:tRNA-2-methylthio-N6-dimethylallyladenosine synthase